MSRIGYNKAKFVKHPLIQGEMELAQAVFCSECNGLQSVFQYDAKAFEDSPRCTCK